MCNVKVNLSDNNAAVNIKQQKILNLILDFQINISWLDAAQLMRRNEWNENNDESRHLKTYNIHDN